MPDEKKDKNSENSGPSPIVNVDHKDQTWVDQFHKFIVDLGGVVDDKNTTN